MQERTVTTAVQKAVIPPPVRTPKVKKEKKKNWVVASGTYLQNGAHVEVKWGKFGEAGNTNLLDEASESESDDDDQEKGLGGEEDIPYEDVDVTVDIPSPMPQQIAKLDRHNMARSTRTQQVDDAQRVGHGGPRGPPCAWGAILTLLCSFLCFVCAIVGVVLLNQVRLVTCTRGVTVRVYPKLEYRKLEAYEHGMNGGEWWRMVANGRLQLCV